MQPSCKAIAVAFLAAVFVPGATALTWAVPQQQAAQAQQQKPNYTLAEYNAYQAAHNEKDPQMKLKDLDDFVMKFPGSALLMYIYGDYESTYFALKNYPKTIEYADKLLALPNVDLGTRLQTLGYRAQAM